MCVCVCMAHSIAWAHMHIKPKYIYINHTKCILLFLVLDLDCESRTCLGCFFYCCDKISSELLTGSSFYFTLKEYSPWWQQTLGGTWGSTWSYESTPQSKPCPSLCNSQSLLAAGLRTTEPLTFCPWHPAHVLAGIVNVCFYLTLLLVKSRTPCQGMVLPRVDQSSHLIKTVSHRNPRGLLPRWFSDLTSWQLIWTTTVTKKHK